MKAPRKSVHIEQRRGPGAKSLDIGYFELNTRGRVGITVCKEVTSEEGKKYQESKVSWKPNKNMFPNGEDDQLCGMLRREIQKQKQHGSHGNLGQM